jgi:biopolymer transport protein ExbB/TolQ
MSWPLLFSLIALGVAGWAVWFLVLASWATQRAQNELRAARLELVTQALRACDEQAAKETALKLLDEVTRQRADDVKALQARLQALEQKYDTTLRLYQSSVALDIPLGPRRVQ